MTLAMIIMICVGCAIGLGGLVILVIRGVGLMKAARQAGISSMDEVQIVIRRAQGLGPRLRELESKQRVVAEGLQRLSATTGQLTYLKDEFDRATGHLSKLKS